MTHDPLWIEFYAGDVPPVVPLCRDVRWDQLRPGECDWQTAADRSTGTTYCGAPKKPGATWCEYHEL